MILVPSSGIATIQQGIDAANTGDTVMVAPGTYYENLVIHGKEITLTSQAGASQTVLSGRDKGSDLLNGTALLQIEDTPSLATTISGFTFQNSFVTSYGCTEDGDAIDLHRAGATILKNAFKLDFDAVAVVQGAVTFTQNTIDLAAPGAGVCEAGEDGVFLSEPGEVVSSELAITTISGNTFSGNGTGSIGILAEDSGPLHIDHNQFTENAVGIVLDYVDENAVIADNVVADGGDGAIQINHSNDNPPSGPANTLIINNTFHNNLYSGVVDNPQAGTYLVAELKITGTYSRVAVVGNIFSTTSISNPILTCDPATTIAYGPPTPLILDHNLFWNPQGQISGGQTCTVPVGSFGNVNADPRFVSSTDVHLTAVSPAIDAGTTGSGYPQGTDLDGNPRVQDGSGRGFSLIDMGAYEFSGSKDADSTSLVLTSSEYYLRTSNSLTLSAQLTDVTQGSALSSQPVTFHVDGGGPLVVSTDASGKASLPVNGLQPGLHTFTASFAGASSTQAHVVAPATAVVPYAYVLSGAPYEPTELTLTSSQNPSNFSMPVTFTVQCFSPDGLHPGPILLSDASLLLATVTPDANGAATYTTSTLAVGTHTLTASYAGDKIHEAGSATLTQLVQPAADFSVSSSAPSITIETEHHASLMLTVLSIGNFAGNVQLSCGALPSYASCTFATPGPQVTVGASAATTLTIDTDAIHGFASNDAKGISRSRIVVAWLWPLALLGLRKGKRRLMTLAIRASFPLFAALGLCGCSSLYPGHTPPGTYLVPVTGTATVNGNLTVHTLQITLVVTP